MRIRITAVLDEDSSDSDSGSGLVERLVSSTSESPAVPAESEFVDAPSSPELFYESLSTSVDYS